MVGILGQGKKLKMDAGSVFVGHQQTATKPLDKPV
jgi:hypothetical protein